METKVLVDSICKAMQAKQAYDINIIDIDKMSNIASYFVVCSAKSTVQVKAIAEEIEFQLEKAGDKAIRKEWSSQPHWIVLDYNDVIAHIFHEETRNTYQLDKLWSNGSNLSAFNEEPTELSNLEKNE
ncbi:MAG: ribosome silencing factor [Clostridia bacterium]|nr:ribosome silencing factor [Clostridia bacterium]